MNYSSYNVTRYLPTVEEAREQGNRTLEAISIFFDVSDASANILEIGCASGSFLKVLRDKGFTNAKGIDIDQELASYGRTALGVNIEVAEWDSYLSENNEVYDIIIALDVLEHIKPTDIESVLKTTFMKLSPKGKLIVRAPNPECPLVLPTYCGDITHKSLITAELLEHLLRQAGFNGSILFKETVPYNKFKCFGYLLLHLLFIKPLLNLIHYHFYGSFPRLITRNYYCCVNVNLK